jgi:hypothetical protein
MFEKSGLRYVRQTKKQAKQQRMFFFLNLDGVKVLLHDNDDISQHENIAIFSVLKRKIRNSFYTCLNR